MKTGDLNYIKYKWVKVMYFTGNVNIKFSVSVISTSVHCVR